MIALTYLKNDPLLCLIIGLMSFALLLILLSIYVLGPQAQAKWAQEQTMIKSLNCHDLGQYLIKQANNETGENYGHNQEYNLADAILHAGACKS